MAFFDKITELTKSATDKAGSMIEVNRLGMRVSSEEKNVAELVRKIGAYYVAKMDAGYEPEAEDAEAAAYYRELLGVRETIEGNKADIQKLKNDGEKRAADVKCTFCGHVNHANAKFCGECGSKLESDKPVCPNCGADLKEGLKFCGECGARVEFELGDDTTETKTEE